MKTVFRSLCLFAVLVASATTSAQDLTLGECESQDEDGGRIFGAECVFIEVAEDHLNPTDELLRIYVQRIPAISGAEKPPIFFIAGGPGQASTDLASQFQIQFRDLLKNHDFVFVDQRGTGRSHPLECDIDLEDVASLSPAEQHARFVGQFKQCLAEFSVSPALVSTAQAVVDLDLVRQSLGYEQIYLWGGSYGTRVNLEYIRQFESRVAGAIFDGLAPVQISLPVNASSDASRALARIFQLCREDIVCNNAFPELQTRWQALLERLENRADRVNLVHPRTEQVQEIYIDHLMLSGMVRFSLYNRELSTLLPLGISKAINGDYSQLYSMQSLGAEKTQKALSEGMHFAVLCAEDYRFSQTKEPVLSVSDSKIRLVKLDTESLTDLCGLFEAATVPKQFFQLQETQVPGLFLSGNTDPVTPPAWAEYVQSFYPNSEHIVAPGGHHIVSPIGCIPDILHRFVEDPQNLESIDTSCALKIKPMQFFVDGAGPILSSDAALSDLAASEVQK